MNLRRVPASAAGWGLTAIKVVVIILVIGDERHATAAVLVLGAAMYAGPLGAVVIGVSCVVVCRRNRMAAMSGAKPVSPRALAVQSKLALVLDLVNGATDDAFGRRRAVLTDRLQLTAASLDALDERWQAMSFI